MGMNPGYPKICKSFKSGNIAQNDVSKISNYSRLGQDRASKFGLFVKEVFLLNLKTFLTTARKM